MRIWPSVQSPERTNSTTFDGALIPPDSGQCLPEAKEDYGGNHVIFEIAPNVFAPDVQPTPAGIVSRPVRAARSGLWKQPDSWPLSLYSIAFNGAITDRISRQLS